MITVNRKTGVGASTDTGIVVKQNPYTAIVIGHTDTMGSEQYNIGLSERRAQRVRQELIRRGIPENIITTKGMGESELLIETADEVAEARNRRVEIDVR